jgi:hypothetical protein
VLRFLERKEGKVGGVLLVAGWLELVPEWRNRLPGINQWLTPIHFDK